MASQRTKEPGREREQAQAVPLYMKHIITTARQKWLGTANRLCLASLLSCFNQQLFSFFFSKKNVQKEPYLSSLPSSSVYCVGYTCVIAGATD